MAQGFEAGRVSAARLLSPGVNDVTLPATSLAGTASETSADVAFRLPVDVWRERGFSAGAVRAMPYWKRRHG